MTINVRDRMLLSAHAALDELLKDFDPDAAFFCTIHTHGVMLNEDGPPCKGDHCVTLGPRLDDMSSELASQLGQAMALGALARSLKKELGPMGVIAIMGVALEQKTIDTEEIRSLNLGGGGEA